MKNQKIILRTVIITAFFSIAYAILRYNIFGNVPWKDFPLYVMNKAISLTAIILFAISSNSIYKTYISEKRVQLRVIINTISFSLIITHVLISLLLFKPVVFTKFFEENGTVTFFTGISMLAGIISFVLLLINKLNLFSSIRYNNTQSILPLSLNVIMIFVFLHLLFMGFSGWITPQKWYGGMPPISLIAIIFSTFILFQKSKRIS